MENGQQEMAGMPAKTPRVPRLNKDGSRRKANVRDPEMRVTEAMMRVLSELPTQRARMRACRHVMEKIEDEGGADGFSPTALG